MIGKLVQAILLCGKELHLLKELKEGHCKESVLIQGKMAKEKRGRQDQIRWATEGKLG